MFRRLLLKLGIYKPDMYDVMDAFIRNYLTKEEITFITSHCVFCRSNNYILRIGDTNRIYFMKHEYNDNNNCYCNSIPDCKEFIENMYEYKEVLNNMKIKKTKLMNKINSEHLERSEKQEQYTTCIKKLWDYVNCKPKYYIVRYKKL